MGRGPWTTEAQIDRAVALRATGLRLIDIAAEVNLHPSTVSRLLNDHVYRDARARHADRMRRVAETRARMTGRANPSAGPLALDPVEYARQHCPTAQPLIQRIRGAR